MAVKWGNFLNILMQVGPLILALNPATAAIAPIIVSAIAEAQQIKGASGPEKKAHAMKIVETAVTLAHGANVKGFEQPALVLATVSDGIDVTVGAVKIVEGTKKPVDVTPTKAA